jgi:hypothetical protein
VSKGVVETLEIFGAVVAAAYGQWALAASLAGAAFSTDQARRAEAKAKSAYNASLRDRYAMVRSTTAARQLVFGRCRVSGPMFFASSYGDDKQHLVLCVALAAHEIDAIETIYFDDQPVTLDGSGNVIGIKVHETFSIASSTASVTVQQTPVGGTTTAQARYGEDVVVLTVTSVVGSTVSVSGARAGQTGQLDVFYRSKTDPFAPTDRFQISETFTVVNGHDTFALTGTPDATGVTAVYKSTTSGANDNSPVTVSGVSGNLVTISGATIGRQVVIYYETSSGRTLARVRTFTGAPGQSADAAMISELPGVWTFAHTASGVAYLVVEMDYDDSAFQGGIPNVSAVVRGMKCFDPRTGKTAWTENPALHARALATNPVGGNLPTTAIDDDAIIDAANVCDTSTTYTVGSADFVRPLYTAGYAYRADQKPSDGLTDIVQAMNGGWVFADGKLRIAAGAYRTPNPVVLDETWLTDDQAVQIQVGSARANLVNTITASIADRSQDYRVVPLPRIAPADYVADDAATLAQDLSFAAVTFGGQAQYIASCMLRQMRQGLTVTMRCNMRAWQAERFDVLLVSLDRFGWDEKAFEVLADTWQPDGSIELTLRETTPLIWDMDIGFPDYDLAPNTNMPSPWSIPEITGLTAISNNSTAQILPDGTVIPRLKVTWGAVTDSRVLLGGYIEIRYWLLGDVDDNFATFKAQGSDTVAFITGIRAGAQYMVTARACSAIAQSPWCAATLTNSGGRTTSPVNVSGMAYTQGSSRVHFTWNADTTDLDYKLTEVRIGSTWAGGTKVIGLAGNSGDWIPTALGSYTAWFAHQTFSGIYSATPQSLAVTVDSSIYGAGGGANGGTWHANGSVSPQTLTAIAAIRFDASGTVSRRQGNNATATYINIGRWISGTPAGSEQISFDLVTQNNFFGTPTVGGTGGGLVALSGSPAVTLTATNQQGTATILFTIFDGGGNSMATGFVFLDAESSP